MIYFLIFFIGITIGVIMGLIITSILTASSNSDDLQKAYNDGFEKGKFFAQTTNNRINNSNNKNIEKI